MQIRIIKPGLLSTVQDLGRLQYRSLAIPLSGVMDNLSARIANKLVGNDDNDAVVEFTYADAAFIAETDILIAYAGLGAKLMADELPIPANKPIFILAGTIVKLVSRPEGCRTYLAVAGGWQVPDILGSKSTFLTAGFGGFEGRILRKNDYLLNNKLSILSQKILNVVTGKSINYPKWSVASPLLWPTDKKTIRVIPANEFSWFDEHGTTSFLTMPYTISLLSNRMGYQLNGPTIKRNTSNELLSTAVVPGTIQVTGNGSLILLMADCQTTGGYPRIAQVAAVDLPLCAQLKSGDTINFKAISRLEAENLYIEREQQLLQLTAAIAIKFI